MIGVIIGIAVIALLFLGAYIFNARNNDVVVPEENIPVSAVEGDSALSTAFLCDDGFTMNATFTEDKVVLQLSDKREMTLLQVDAELGARFQNSDNSIALTVLGPNASLEENGAVTHAECIQPKG